jgi:hypothetical protein
MRLAALLFLLVLLSVGLPCLAAAEDNNTAGMVLDVQGSAQLIDDGASAPLQLLAYLKAGEKIRLAAGGKASLSLYANRTLYLAKGPALLEVRQDKLLTLEGTPPATRNMAEKLVNAARTGDEVTGAYRLRKVAPRLVLQRPEPSSLMLKLLPVFCWSATEPAEYALEVEQVPDGPVFHATTRDTCWTTPAQYRLSYGHTYRWQIRYRSQQDGREINAEEEFTIPPEQEAIQLAALKPPREASIEEWIMYAAVMRSHTASEEEDEAWRIILEKRPDLEQAYKLIND